MMAGAETPERTRKLGRNVAQEQLATTCPHCRSVVFPGDSRCRECDRKVVLPEPVRVAYDQWPLKRLYATGILARTQYHAGLRYYEHWYGSGLSPMGAIDMNRVGGSTEPSVGMPVSLRQAEHRKFYREAEEALGPEFSPYVNAIVLQEQEPAMVGRRLTGRAAEPQARAVAIEFLKAGLDRLAKEFAL